MSVSDMETDMPEMAERSVSSPPGFQAWVEQGCHSCDNVCGMEDDVFEAATSYSGRQLVEAAYDVDERFRRAMNALRESFQELLSMIEDRFM